MPPPPNFRSILNWTSLLLSLFILNFALTFHNVWPTLGITSWHELSVEIAVLLLVLALYSHFRAAISPHLITVLAILLTILTLARYLEVTAPALFGRPVNLYWDAQYLPSVAGMLAEVATPLQIALIVAGTLLALALIFLVLRFSLNRVVHGLTKPREWRALALAASVLTLGYLIDYAHTSVHTLQYYSLPLTKTYWGQIKFVASALASETTEMLPPDEPLQDFDLSGLHGSDVIVQFIESYGAAAFDTPAIARTVTPAREAFADSVSATGRRVVSAFVTSPTFGGNSWLAHSSFMTGLNIDQLPKYDLLLTQQRTTLSNVFSTQGYRPVALMPGMRAKWPEGSFYDFAAIYGAPEIDYRGPEFGWWRIPDQFSLERLHSLEIARQPRQPLLVLFTTITSHMPFRPTPPYQADWSRLLSDTPFDQQAVDNSLTRIPEWTNLQPAYADTLVYNFNYLNGYLRNHADDDFFWVLIGDHQPPAAVSGPGVRWDVPVHIVSSDNAIIDALRQQGFVEGMTPAKAPISTIPELTVTLLSVFSQ